MNGGVAAPIQEETSPHSAKSDPSNPCSGRSWWGPKLHLRVGSSRRVSNSSLKLERQEQSRDWALPGAPARWCNL